jgi:DNA-binding response OmpR family regulator
MPSIGRPMVWRPIRRLATVTYDLLILDLGLPKLPGLEVLKRLRARNSQVPVLILTALDGTGDRVKGSISGPTTTWSSPSSWLNWRPACAP